MHPEEIKARMRMQGTRPSDLAAELQISRSMVTHVIHGRYVSRRVSSRIAEITGVPVERLWPAKVSRKVKEAAVVDVLS